MDAFQRSLIYVENWCSESKSMKKEKKKFLFCYLRWWKSFWLVRALWLFLVFKTYRKLKTLKNIPFMQMSLRQLRKIYLADSKKTSLSTLKPNKVFITKPSFIYVFSLSKFYFIMKTDYYMMLVLNVNFRSGRGKHIFIEVWGSLRVGHYVDTIDTMTKWDLNRNTSFTDFNFEDSKFIDPGASRSSSSNNCPDFKMV